MRILNFGSLNYDYVYSVHHIVAPGETLSSSKMELFCGGKGLNQSIALAKAGADVFHGGMVGADGDILLEKCASNEVDINFIKKVDGKNGHAMIQVNEQGQNSIILYAGSNGENTLEYIEEVLSHFGEGDMLLLQNEVNLLSEMIEEAYKRKMTIVLNPSPFNELVAACDLNKVSIFLMNEIEGFQITGEKDPENILKAMEETYPNAEVVLTLGDKGVCYAGKGNRHQHESYKVEVVDSTAAGDTFTGYFLSAVLEGRAVEEALHRASLAASIAVTRKGASDSIPMKEDVDRMIDFYS